MPEVNHYHTLGIDSDATQAEIKQAYRTLAKQFHPDRYEGSDETANYDRIVAINAAYEILGDVNRRYHYDQSRFWGHTPSYHQSDRSDRQERTATVQHQYQRKRPPNEDEQISQWLKDVYTPVNRLIGRVLNSYKMEINQLAADPFDDELMENFQAYLEDCRQGQSEAEHLFQSRNNPPQIARFATTVYYCLSHVGDGLKELEHFTTSYDENYLHTGREMFRLAIQLRQEAQSAYRRCMG
jgi:molecular chaperone DnaJ